MRTIVVTGAAGGIGRATCTRLEKNGDRVIGVDVRDAEIIADLATVDGRNEMVAAVERACDSSLDGLVAGAGVMGDSPDVVSINYFGGGASFANVSTSSSVTEVFGTVVLGYRYQPPDGGFFLRAGIDPIIGNFGFLPWPYVGLGATF